MADQDRIRLRVRYVKEGRLAHLGHLEVLRTIDRSVRRSGLPFAVGNGFARRMRIQFCQALPVGSSSAAEYYDLQLTEPVEEGLALERLASATPGDLMPIRVAYVEPRLPALEAWLDRQSWTARIDRAPCVDSLRAAIQELREERDLAFMRGDKPRTVCLDDTLVSCELEGVEDGVVVRLETRATGRGALRPQILIGAALDRLGASGSYVRVRRIAQAHDGGAALVEPFDKIWHPALT